jgi:hypothetical protein
VQGILKTSGVFKKGVAMKSFYTFIKQVLIPLVTILTAVMVAVLNNSVSKVESQLKERQEERAERESSHSFDLKIYDKVITSLEEGDEQKQKVAQALVDVMASDSFRVKLMNALQKTAVDTVKKEVEKIIKIEHQYEAEQRKLKRQESAVKTATTWQSYNYDIFWCDEYGDETKQTAEMLIKRLEEAGVTGRLRVRQLPESINTRKGYNISGAIIRRNDDEDDIAEMLAKVAFEMGIDMEITRSSQPTPNYISAFICQ